MLVFLLIASQTNHHFFIATCGECILERTVQISHTSDSKTYQKWKYTPYILKSASTSCVLPEAEILLIHLKWQFRKKEIYLGFFWKVQLWKFIFKRRVQIYPTLPTLKIIKWSILSKFYFVVFFLLLFYCFNIEQTLCWLPWYSLQLNLWKKVLPEAKILIIHLKLQFRKKMKKFLYDYFKKS